MIDLDNATVGQIPAVSLEERRDTLHARLEAGFQTIEQAAREGQDVSRWEQGWLRLLQEYQDVCDQLSTRYRAA